MPGATEEITPLPIFTVTCSSPTFEKTLPGVSIRLTYSERLEQLSGPFWWGLCLYGTWSRCLAASPGSEWQIPPDGKNCWLQELQNSYMSSACTSSLTWQIRNGEPEREAVWLPVQSTTPHDITTPPKCCAHSFHIRLNVCPPTHQSRPIDKPVYLLKCSKLNTQAFRSFYLTHQYFLSLGQGFALLKLSALLEYVRFLHHLHSG